VEPFITHQDALTKRKIAEMRLHDLIGEHNKLDQSKAGDRWIAQQLAEQIKEAKQERDHWRRRADELKPVTSNYVNPYRSRWP
jgi:hypothetical protein